MKRKNGKDGGLVAIRTFVSESLRAGHLLQGQGSKAKRLAAKEWCRAAFDNVTGLVLRDWLKRRKVWR